MGIKDFSIVKYTNAYDYVQADILNQISQEILDFLKSKNYGSGVKNIILGLVSMEPKFASVLKLGMPKYVKYHDNYDGSSSQAIENLVTYSFSINYDIYWKGSAVEVFNAVQEALINSIDLIDPLKIPDFDKVKFKHDFIEFVSQMKIES